jgi:hypothetical protein
MADPYADMPPGATDGYQPSPGPGGFLGDPTSGLDPRTTSSPPPPPGMVPTSSEHPSLPPSSAAGDGSGAGMAAAAVNV